MPDYSHLLDQQVTESNSTQFEQCPEGEYIARIDDFELSTAEWNDKNTGQPRSAPTLRITWHVLDEGVKAATGLDPVRVQQDLFLDIDETTGALSTAKNSNVMLGRIRQALGLNEPGQPFSLGQLKGSLPAMVRVALVPDRKSPEIKRAKVTNVARATM
jgi:hypothetical protein